MSVTTTRPVTGPRPAHRLVALYDVMAAERGQVERWTDLSLLARGSLRSMWAVARTGQRDPWLVALTGFRYRRAFLATNPRYDHLMAGQYLAAATRIVVAADPSTIPDADDASAAA